MDYASCRSLPAMFFERRSGAATGRFSGPSATGHTGRLRWSEAAEQVAGWRAA